jgi:hypothetical protein
MSYRGKLDSEDGPEHVIRDGDPRSEEEESPSGEDSNEKKQERELKARLKKIQADNVRRKRAIEEKKQRPEYKKVRELERETKKREIAELQRAMQRATKESESTEEELRRVNQGTDPSKLPSHSRGKHSESGSRKRASARSEGRDSESSSDEEDVVKDGRKGITDSDGNKFRVLNQQIGGEKTSLSRGSHAAARIVIDIGNTSEKTERS